MYVLILYADIVGAQIICRLLEAAGHHPLWVTSDSDAALALACARFDVLIVDLDYAPAPVCRSLSLISGDIRAETAIIGISRDTGTLARHAAADACLDCVLLKPLDPFTIRTALGTLASSYPQLNCQP